MIEKRKVGRPRKYGDEKLGKTYFVRLTDAQYAALKKAAAGRGVSVADYIRILALIDNEVMNKLMDTLMNGKKEN